MKLLNLKSRLKLDLHTLSQPIKKTAVVAGLSAMALLAGGAVASGPPDVSAAYALIGNSDVLDDDEILVEDEECVVPEEDTADYKADEAETDAMEIAKKIASVLTEFGVKWNDVMGALGNAQGESGFAYPFTELMHDPKHWKAGSADDREPWADLIRKHGPQAEAIFKNGWGSVLSHWSGTASLGENTYIGNSPDGTHYVGFGIWQWTGYNGVMPYFKWAWDNKLDPVNVDTMLIWAVGDNSDYFKKYGGAQDDFYFKRLKELTDNGDSKSPGDGAYEWAKIYEGNIAIAVSEKMVYAAEWDVKLKKSDLDPAYAKSILSAAKTSSAKKASSDNAEDALAACGPVLNAGDSRKVKYTRDEKSKRLVRTDSEEGVTGNKWSKAGLDFSSEANTYPVGQCTWGVKEVATWVGNYYGNGGNWAHSARKAGFTVGDEPAVGAIAVYETTDVNDPNVGEPGHVAVVKEVKDGKFSVVETNIQGYQSHPKDFFGLQTIDQHKSKVPGTLRMKFIYPPKGFKTKF